MARTTKLNGKSMTLAGPEIKVGQKAPDFHMVDIDGKEETLSQSQGKIRLLSVVHSLDTPVCNLQTQRFEQAAKFPGVVIYTVSMDLPFAQARYASANNIQNIKILSDHRLASLGRAYGVLIEDLRLLSRAIFIIDQHDVIRYVEYVPEVSQAPDYDKALAALRGIAGVPAAAGSGA
ncbi:MAG: thiol peroxidase [Dehalococcoidales bacterium]|nr:thiol peroxidase [Dehalococcoidales bacterium]